MRPDFQYISTGPNGNRFIFFTIGTSYLQTGKPTYNVTGVDNDGNNYTAIMQRSLYGEFIIQNLTLVT